MIQPDAVLIQVPTVTVESTRINRGLQLFSSLSWLTSVVASFCRSLLAGAAGGLLLGWAAVLSQRSLKLLADNKLIIGNLENYIVDPLEEVNQNLMLPRTRNYNMFNTYISLLIEDVVICFTFWPVGVAVLIGALTYDLMTERYLKVSKGKALALAGPVCLMGATATGYLLNPVLESLLSTCISNAYVLCLYAVEVIVLLMLNKEYPPLLLVCFLPPLSSSIVVLTQNIIFLYFKTKLTLMLSFFPAIMILSESIHDNKPPNIAALPLVLMITDAFNIAELPIISSDSSNSANMAVVEGLFVGVLILQLLMMVVGMSLFACWQTGGATKSWLSAAAFSLGVAVLMIVQTLLHLLGPLPTMGALMGVAGAAGLCLAAAVAVAEQCENAACRYSGGLGVAVGSAVGAFLLSYTQSGLSTLFMGLWAVTIPCGLYTQLFLFVFQRESWWKLNFFLSVIILISFSVWLYFICTIFGVCLIISAVSCLVLFAFIQCWCS